MQQPRGLYILRYNDLMYTPSCIIDRNGKSFGNDDDFDKPDPGGLFTCFSITYTVSGTLHCLRLKTVYLRQLSFFWSADFFFFFLFCLVLWPLRQYCWIEKLATYLNSLHWVSGFTAFTQYSIPRTILITVTLPKFSL